MRLSASEMKVRLIRFGRNRRLVALPAVLHLPRPRFTTPFPSVISITAAPLRAPDPSLSNPSSSSRRTPRAYATG